jgi:hypothetical protein
MTGNLDAARHRHVHFSQNDDQKCHRVIQNCCTPNSMVSAFLSTLNIPAENILPSQARILCVPQVLGEATFPPTSWESEMRNEIEIFSAPRGRQSLDLG